MRPTFPTYIHCSAKSPEYIFESTTNEITNNKQMEKEKRPTVLQ